MEKLNSSSEEDRLAASVAIVLHSSGFPGLSSGNVIIAELYAATQNVTQGNFFGAAARLFEGLDGGMQAGEDISIFLQRNRDLISNLEKAQLPFGLKPEDVGIDLRALSDEDVLARLIVINLERQLGDNFRYTQHRGNWELRNDSKGPAQDQLAKIGIADLLDVIDRKNKGASDISGSNFLGLPRRGQKKDKKDPSGRGSNKNDKNDPAAFNAVGSGIGKGKDKGRKGGQNDRSARSSPGQQQFAIEYCTAARKIGEAATNGSGDLISRVNAAVLDTLQQGYDKLSAEAKKCFNISNMKECEDTKFLTVKDVGYLDEAVSSSPGGAYIKAACDMSLVNDKAYHKWLGSIIFHVRKKVDDKEDKYNFAKLLQKWNKESTLADYLRRQKRYSDKSKVAKAAAADDGDQGDSDEGDE